ncbi:thioredoxin [Patiriisocius marinistellae]|uniref:Thioredoxin n=2 Tax=Patiriisocius marinistellae TaxID=2494560 RepID=A0A5J4FWN8_9FLAO|nr:thioredoxin [Patiriisocius marinistellae]
MRTVKVTLVLLLTFASCNSSKKDIVNTHQFKNLLVNETSPYLLQHANNPVDWLAWNDVTFATAKEKNKLIIISIGYAACHWCHVMEHESFEDNAVADVMNENYISIKVDREERPDVDQIYINAVQLMTGSAGWPLNVVALPDGRPVWGGTYFKKRDWISALEQIQKIYVEDPDKLIENANQLEAGIKSMDLVPLNTDKIDYPTFNTNQIVKKWSESFDHKFGGLNRAPKFMMPSNYAFLLRYAKQEKDEHLMNYVDNTLQKIAYGGIYDHIGGGFSRYSVDTKWHVPHFEKMLYDNGQLASLYSDAYTATKNPLYKEVVEGILAFVALELTDKNGGFYSSLDADSIDQNGNLNEGAYYIYSKEEIQTQIGDDFEIFKEYYNINNYGIWENNHYVLIRDKSDLEILKNFNISLKQLQEKKTKWKKILLNFRSKRNKPRLDDKILTSWNGLMLKGYVDAYKVFGNKDYLKIALKNANFIKDNVLQEDGALFRNHKNGKSNINGYLEDYATVIDAYISLYEASLDEQWLQTANQLTEYTFKHFFDTKNQMFYYTNDKDPALVSRNFEYRDNVIPASNSIHAKNLFKLAHYIDNNKYNEVARQMLANVTPEIQQYPTGFSNWLDLLMNYKNSYYEVVVVGKNAKEKIKAINTYYLPNALLAGSITEGNSPLIKERYIDGKTMIYICVNNACKLPETDVKKSINPIKL